MTDTPERSDGEHLPHVLTSETLEEALGEAYTDPAIREGLLCVGMSLEAYQAAIEHGSFRGNDLNRLASGDPQLFVLPLGVPLERVNAYGKDDSPYNDTNHIGALAEQLLADAETVAITDHVIRMVAPDIDERDPNSRISLAEAIGDYVGIGIEAPHESAGIPRAYYDKNVRTIFEALDIDPHDVDKALRERKALGKAGVIVMLDQRSAREAGLQILQGNQGEGDRSLGQQHVVTSLAFAIWPIGQYERSVLAT